MSKKVYYVGSNTESNDFYDFGVKGMKWGIRRTASQLGRSAKGKIDRESKATVDNYNADVKKTSARMRKLGLNKLADKYDGLQITKAREILYPVNPGLVKGVKQKTTNTLRGVIANRQEKGAKNLRKDAADFDKHEVLNRKKVKKLEQEASNFDKEVSKYEKTYKKPLYPNRAESKAEQRDRALAGTAYQLAKKKRKQAATTTEEADIFRESSKAFKQMAKEWDQAAANNRKKIKHEYSDLFEDDVYTEFEQELSDDSIIAGQATTTHILELFGDVKL